ncbi:probable pre-mRNA-splicing factor ATP-dependent RNA helicase DEAH9 isoform X5 [Amborella trichopoda]|uniref:probable pre-mRNA-splicing factor ATP-dependent RNA helicase DEAH9 isoform X5 n=1 Tax=Amborella trichopoda TaxID=13333 RepID=UPI0009BD1CEB|nr:probable pre-mRNA-splicing factor ATP-dependent RNA helicase DEAH9 isoform X5 [Amborella trichopoda]|eukprot:XP_020527986.1 probable pre-mRNA-splicing factor ATP-dependent RNA helicase DEAH9 isoform X5 [Amborella trichopoda]
MSRFWRPGSERPQPSSLSVLEDDEPGFLPFSTLASNSSYGYGGLERHRQRLPVFKYRTAILYLLETHATTIIVGETGSGKTTQIPQHVLDTTWRGVSLSRLVLMFVSQGSWLGRWWAGSSLYPTQKIGSSVASRVAEEMDVKLGEEVGYTIRFEDLTKSAVTRIKFLTDGVLLREMMDDPLLSKYSVVMVDEAHERSLSTDMLLGLLKKIQRRRPELRLIISSATIEAKSIAAFFNQSKKKLPASRDFGPSREPAILSVEGRGYDVQIHFLEEPVSNYLQAAVSTVLDIHNQEPMGDVLVFLTGQDDIDAAVQMLTDEAQNLAAHRSGLLVLPLYAGLSRAEQELVFSPTPRGKRKVVIATNIAETSLTLEGMVYVVDSGFSKQRFYNPITDIESLVVAPISKASARQRAGRAGRVRPGKCFRLYTEEYFESEMPLEGIPEMQRSNLVSCVIQLKALGIDNILGFDWLASPSPEGMIRALEVLYSLGILDEDSKLTSPTGFQVAEMPLGDHITYLNVYKGFLLSGKSSQWCHKNLINYQAMKKVLEIREQLHKLVQRLGLVLKSCGQDTQVHKDAHESDLFIYVVRKAITSGFFAHACRLESSSHGGMYKTIRTSQEVYIHPSSVLFRVTPKWVVYHSLVSTDCQYMRNVIAVDSSWFTELAPHFFQI